MSLPQPRPVFEHPALGHFVAEDDVWISTVRQDDRDLELALAGTGTAPHENLLVAASALLARFSEVKGLALDFLTAQEESPSREDFICFGLQLLLEDQPTHFSMTFILFEDLGGSWRVEFEDGEPEFLTRDD